MANLFNTNIFNPFPLTLAFSEHFLMISAQALPFLLVADSHLVGMNLSVLVTFILSGYAMVLLVTDWTGHRWAGLVAGVLFAFSPLRFGQLPHLELLVTQWMPLTLLALHWTLTRRGLRYPILFILFLNLQALSGFHYFFNLVIACALLTLVYVLTRRVRWRRGLWVAAAWSIVVTLLFNWPVWRMYLRFNDAMAAIRTPGEVRIYSAALTDYFTSIPHNLLYGKILKTFGRWQPAGHQFQPLMPVGLAGFLLAILGLAHQIKTRFKMQLRPRAQHRLQTTPNAQRPTPNEIRNTKYEIRNTSYAFPTILFFTLLILLALLLSFGLNEQALGPGLAPLLKLSPYSWLYNHVVIFQGIRVPGRYGILVVLGLAGLAGWGAARLSTLFKSASQRIKQPSNTQSAPRPTPHAPRPTHYVSSIPYLILIALILLESWSAPLVGPEFPAGQDIAPV